MVRDTGSTVGHCIACTDILKHLNIVVLVTESNTFFRFDMKYIQKLRKSSAFVCARSNKINPDITGSDNLYLRTKHILKLFEIFINNMRPIYHITDCDF